MSPQAFDALAEQAVAALPLRFRRRLRNIVIIVEPEPPRADLLGLYEGGQPFGLPDRITIYQGPHQRLARNPAHLAQLLAETVFHEVGHAFGLNEREVLQQERRLRRARRP